MKRMKERARRLGVPLALLLAGPLWNPAVGGERIKKDDIESCEDLLNYVLGGSDPDEDGLENCEEMKRGTDPENDDTDGDLYSDGREVEAATDPLDGTHYPDDEPDLFPVKWQGKKTRSPPPRSPLRMRRGGEYKTGRRLHGRRERGGREVDEKEGEEPGRRPGAARKPTAR